MKLIALFVLLFLPQLLGSQTNEEIENTLNQYLFESPNGPPIPLTDEEVTFAELIADINLRCDTTIIELGSKSFYELACQTNMYGSLQFDYITRFGERKFIERYNYIKDGAVMLEILPWVIVVSFITSDDMMVFLMIPISPVDPINRA